MSMDHTNCPNPEECKRYEEYAKLMDDPDQWAYERALARKRSEKGRREAAQAGTAEVEEGGHEVVGRPLDMMISVRFDSAQFRAIHEAAEVRNMTISCFIRDTALKAAALPYVKIISDFPVPTTYTA